MNSQEREEVAKQLAEELGMKVLPDSGVWIKYKSCQPLRNDIRDALISREMRVRELEATLADVANTIGGPTMHYASPALQLREIERMIKKAVDIVQLALNYKGGV